MICIETFDFSFATSWPRNPSQKELGLRATPAVDRTPFGSATFRGRCITLSMITDDTSKTFSLAETHETPQSA
jgi:hypothetical protein